MRKCNVFSCFLLLFVFAPSSGTLFSQQPEKKLPPDSSVTRLANAKNVLVMRARGNDIPYDVIKSAIDGWGRFALVEAPDKADLVVTVATTGGDSNVKVGPTGGFSPFNGRPDASTTTREFSDAEITMTVYDAKSKRMLWVATATAKSALKQTTRENNLVEAAERLAVKFHDRLEPPPTKDNQ
jgi:hypothetical protein